MFHSAPISIQWFLAELPYSASLTVYLRRPQYVTLILILEYGLDFLLSPISPSSAIYLRKQNQAGDSAGKQIQHPSAAGSSASLDGWAPFSFLWCHFYEISVTQLHQYHALWSTCGIHCEIQILFIMKDISSQVLNIFIKI